MDRLIFFTRSLFFIGIIFPLMNCNRSEAEGEAMSLRFIEIEVDEVQRDNIPFTIKNLSDGAASWYWEIRHAETGNLVSSSSATHPELTLPKGAYDILVTGTGTNTLSRHFRRKVTVLPRVFTEAEADEVIDLSKHASSMLVREYRQMVRPGYKILIKGKLEGRLLMKGLQGTRDNPVHIINKGQVILQVSEQSNPPYAWHFNGHNHYILIDGKADPNVPYGFKLIGNPQRTNQIFFITGELNRGFEMCGVYIIGQRPNNKGAAAIKVQPSYTRISNASNWNFDYLKIHHTKIEEANAEGMYIGYFTDEERNTGYAPYRMGQVLIYRDTVINSGWDAMQVACADEFEIHDNYVDKASLGGKRSHSSFISWNSGNKVGYCYRNTFRNAAHAASIFFGRTGKEAYLYSNLLIEGTYPDSIIAPAFIYSRLENTYQDIGLYIFHNTIITERMPVKTAYINKYDDRGITVVFAGNAIQMNQKYGRNFPEIELEKTMRDSASWIIRNEWRMSSKTKELKWDKSYRPAKDSPLIGSHFDIQKNFPNLKGGHYDRDGYPLFVDGKGYTYGCYSGYPLFSKTTQ